MPASTTHRRIRRFLVLFAMLCVPMSAHAAEEAHGATAEVWLVLAAVLLFAKLGGEIAMRLKQPPVLGELLAGIVLGNLHLVGIPLLTGVGDLPPIAFLAELGVVLLLFEVGLESTVTEMRKVAPQSGLVAVVGVIFPILLGAATSYALLPTARPTLHLFVGATMCATSVGITARVLKDLNAMKRIETRIVLGAAVIDDVLGLIVLAIVAAIARSGTLPDALELTRIIALAVGFLVGALLLGAFVMPGVYLAASKLRTAGVVGAVSIGLCLLLAGISAQAGLAAIVGAFAAGLILDEVHVRPFGMKDSHDLSQIVAPIVAVIAPIFFVRTGMLVDFASVTPHALLLASALSVVAVISKLAAGFGVIGRGADRFTVGIGMVPRGEVGLIFANVGRSIHVDGSSLIDGGTYIAVVLMIMVSTVVVPPWLAWRIRKLSPVE